MTGQAVQWASEELGRHAVTLHRICFVRPARSESEVEYSFAQRSPGSKFVQPLNRVVDEHQSGMLGFK